MITIIIILYILDFFFIYISALLFIQFFLNFSLILSLLSSLSLLYFFHLHALSTEPPLLNKLLFFTRQVNEELHVDLSVGHLPAFPFPTFKWSRPGGKAVVNTTERLYGYPSVSIDSVQPSDRGSYNLTAMNYLYDGITLVGNVAGSFYLDVLCE